MYINIKLYKFGEFCIEKLYILRISIKNFMIYYKMPKLPSLTLVQIHILALIFRVAFMTL